MGPHLRMHGQWAHSRKENILASLELLLAQIHALNVSPLGGSKRLHTAIPASLYWTMTSENAT